MLDQQRLEVERIDHVAPHAACTADKPRDTGDPPIGDSDTDTDADTGAPGAAETCNGIDDALADAYPGAEETCEDGVDQDCRGEEAACPPGLYGGSWPVGSGGTTQLYGTYYADSFGEVMVAGDVDGDGVDDLVLREWSDGGSVTDGGSVWIWPGG